MHERPTKRIGLGWFFLGGVTLVFTWTLYQWFRPSPPIRVSRQTTYLTSPIGADGLPDYVLDRKNRLGRGVAPHENAAVFFWRAMGRAYLPSEAWGTLANELGGPLPDESEGLYWLVGWGDDGVDNDLVVSLGDWLWSASRGRMAQSVAKDDVDEDYVKSNAWELIGFAEAGPWRRSDCPPLADRLDRDETLFSYLHKAADCPVFYQPETRSSTGDIEAQTWEVGRTLMDMARALALRAYLRIGQGEPDAAWTDLKTGLRLLSLFPADLLGDLLSVQTAESTLEVAVIHLLNDANMTPALADEIANDLARLPSRWKALPKTLLGERLFSVRRLLEGLDEPYEKIAQDSYLPALTAGLYRGSIDWNVALEKLNANYDRYQNLLQIADPQTRTDRLNEWEQTLIAGGETAWQIGLPAVSYLHPTKRSEIVADATLGNTAEPFSLFVAAVEENEVRRALLVQTARVISYRIATRQWPDSLEDPATDRPIAAMIDPIYGKPFCYRILDAGGVLVYSLGPNGRDDWGSNEALPSYRGVPLSHDLFLRMTDELGVAREALKRAGEWQSIASPLEPSTWISPGADDISIRLPPLAKPFAESLKDLVESLATERDVEADADNR
jgi:hypothetical protein